MSKISNKEELDTLIEQEKILTRKINDIKKRIKMSEGRVETGIKIKVNSEKCTGCGACEKLCPYNAVTINSVAHIDENKCRICGICVEKCPQEAIMIVQEDKGVIPNKSETAKQTPDHRTDIGTLRRWRMKGEGGGMGRGRRKGWS